MSMLKRALLCVTRKKGKSILLFAILLSMGTFVLTGLSIRTASKEALLALRQSLGGKFSVFVDWENSPYIVKEILKESESDDQKTQISYLMYSTVQLTPEQLSKVKEIPGVRHVSARLDDLVPFEELSLFPGTVPVDSKYRKNTKVYGVLSTEEDELFTTGTLTLSEGKHILPGKDLKEEYTALISKDLAERNGLRVGDFITARCYDAKKESYTGKELKFRIVGLFMPNVPEAFGEAVATYDKIKNRIFVDFQAMAELDGSGIQYGFSAADVTIDDPAQMDRILSELKALKEIDWDAFTVQADNEAYESAAAPLSALNSLVSALLSGAVLAGAIILSLLLTLQTKARVHESGILLSIGIRKYTIVGQYLTEVLLIAALAFGLSCFTGSAVANQLGSYLLAHGSRTETESEVVSAAASVDIGGDRLIESPSANEGISVSIKAGSVLLLCLIGSAVITVSVGVSSVTVLRLKPREILSKMS